MPDPAKAAVAGGHLGFPRARDPVAQPQIGVPDNGRAQSGRPVATTRTHGRRSIDELGLPDRFHFGRAAGTIHRAALDKHGLRNIVAAAGVGE